METRLRPALSWHLSKKQESPCFSCGECQGHHHPYWDVTGRLRYINPGSAGCTPTPDAHFAIVDLNSTGAVAQCKRINYDDHLLWPTFQQRTVPERNFLAEIFFGGRW